MNTDTRAVLMTGDEWNAVEAMQTEDCDIAYVEHLGQLGDKWWAAGEQPRLQWCIEHGQYATTSHHQGDQPVRYSCGQGSYRFDRDPSLCDCRVVSALVVPLQEKT